jgi:peptidoglycan hydrolase-like protein with peptidoglycan-binding domain
VSTAISPMSTDAPRPPHLGDPDDAHPPRRRRGRIAASVALLVVAAVVAVVLVDPFAGTRRHAPALEDNAYPTSVATVQRRFLSSQTEVDGTLRFSGSSSVVNGAAGALTALPHAGQVIRRGQVLYRVAGKPVLLLYGQTPAYRTLKEGMSGADVRQLNANLAALGYGTSWLDAMSDEFTATTAYALKQWQDAYGFKQTGVLDLGRVVFLPGAARITKVMATLGTSAQPGVVIAQASSTRKEVLVDLDADLQTEVKTGDRVTIRLPDGKTTPGIVHSIGQVAQGAADKATVPVHVRLLTPDVIGSLDQATVRVAITTSHVKRALVVPVTSLLALAGGGYAVEVVSGAGLHRLVPVRTGLFDEANGLVQVTSDRLTVGQKIVVPAS